MKFINEKMIEYNQGNSRKKYIINLIIINGQFILLFIPKIFTFLFCYFVFYREIIKFKSWFYA